VELRPVRGLDTPDIMACGKAVGAEIPRDAEQVSKLDPLVALHAGDRGPAAGVIVGEPVDHIFPEAGREIENIMGDAEAVSDGSSVVYVPPGATALGAADRLAMIVELECDSNHLGTASGGERGHDRTIDAA